MNLSDINIYPVKSCRGYSVESADVEERGLNGDRRAMFIDTNGKFITLRTHSQLALIEPRRSNDYLALIINGESVQISFSNDRADVQVWRDTVSARLAMPAINTCLSKYLKDDIRLVEMDGASKRQADQDWTESAVSFADGYPISIVNTASLEALSRTANSDISMSQFRPNIIINSETPWAEDSWRTLKIGDVIFDLVKPINRCKIVTLDPKTGERVHPETMNALIKSRRSGDNRVKGVLFGWAAVPRNLGTLQRGDSVAIVETGDPWPVQ